MIVTGNGWEMHLGDCLEVMRGLGRVDHVSAPDGVTRCVEAIGRCLDHLETCEALPAVAERRTKGGR